MSAFDTVLIIGGLALVAYLVWPVVDKNLTWQSEQWLKDPANVQQLKSTFIKQGNYARAYSGCNCGR